MSSGWLSVLGSLTAACLFASAGHSQATVTGEVAHRSALPLQVLPPHAFQKLLPDTDSSTHSAQFGVALAVSPSHIVIGSSETNDGVPVAGAAYIFEHVGCTWVRRTKLTSPGLQGGAFGVSVAIDDDTIVVGSRDEGSAGQGVAYVLEWNGVDWVLAATLLPTPGGPVFTAFGAYVAIDGDTIVVGSPFNPGAAGVDCGAAYVYVRPGANWRDETSPIYETTRPIAASPLQSEQLGHPVAIHRGLIAAGASHINGGAVHLFEEPTDGWAAHPTVTTMARIVPPTTTSPNDAFGIRLDVQRDDAAGDLLAVGAWATNHQGAKSGVAYVAREPAGGWPAFLPQDLVPLTSSELDAGDYFGTAIDIDGRRVTVGAPQDDAPIGGLLGEGGRLFVFEHDGATWEQTLALQVPAKTLPGSQYPPSFGYDAGLTHSLLVVSAIDDDNIVGPDAGAVYVFTVAP